MKFFASLASSSALPRLGRRLALLPLLTLVGVMVNACGDDEEAVVNTGPTAPPSLTIEALVPTGAPSWQPGDSCVELGRDPAQTVGVRVLLENYLLRPPAACGGRSQCGRLLVRVDPQGESEALRVESAQRLVEVPFVGLGAGTHTIRVEALRDNGTAYTRGGQVLFAEVSVDVVSPGQCGGSLLDASVEGGTDDAGVEDAATDGAPDGASDDSGADAASDAESPDAGSDAADLDAGADAADAAASDGAVSDGGDASVDDGSVDASVDDAGPGDASADAASD